MKIVVTGSLGHVSKPLTGALVQNGHVVTVVSSKAVRQKEIESMGAKAAIGSIDDSTFLTSAFQGADIAYIMEPPINFFDQQADTETYWTNIAKSYAHATLRSGVKHLVHLSSIGAHTDKGNGILATHHYVENILRGLPDDVSVKFMRPVGFYHNMFAYIPTIKAQNAIFQNYGGDEKEPWVSPVDIAATVVDEMEKPFEGKSVRYIVSDEVSPNQVAKVLGEAIGKPDLRWVVVPDEQFLNGLLSVGFNPNAAKGLTEMNAGRRNNLYEDYQQHKPAFGKVKLTDFAKEFAIVYNQH
jgi:uncharacterized protein YbjT (DUF2867 family)